MYKDKVREDSLIKFYTVYQVPCLLLENLPKAPAGDTYQDNGTGTESR